MARPIDPPSVGLPLLSPPCLTMVYVDLPLEQISRRYGEFVKNQVLGVWW